MTKKKNPEDLLKRGRPSKIEGIDLEMVCRLAEIGLTVDEIAHALDLNRDTVYEYQKLYPNFSDALKRGKAIADNEVEVSLYKRAMGYSHPEEKIFCNNGEIVRANTIKHYPPDTAALAIWLKNRRPDLWRDRFEVGVDVTPADKILDWLKAAGDGGVDAMFNNLNNKQEETMGCGKKKPKPRKRGKGK